MKKKNKNKRSLRYYTVRKYTVNGVIFGFIFTILAWSVFLIQSDYSFSPEGIRLMHIQQPIAFFLDLSPIVTGIFSYFMARRIGVKRDIMQSEMIKKERIIEQNAKIARRIGEGDFSVSESDILPGDKLGQSLLLMRNNLVTTYQKETEQNWIARGKEIISNILSHHNNIEILAYETLVSLINYTDSIQGSFYIYNEENNTLVNVSTYAYNRRKYVSQEFKIGQGLVGQTAYEREYIYRKEIPMSYVTISSGILGDKKPKTILVSPFIGDEKLQGVIEIASLKEEMPGQMITLFIELSEVIGQTLFNLKVNTQTENLLKESQNLTKKLQRNEDELRKNAQQMKLTQIELEKSNVELASKISEVERGQERLHSLLQNASEVITIYDNEGRVKYVSPSVKSILGFNPDEMIGENRFERGESILQDAFDELIKDPTTEKTFEYTYENKNKELVWLETIGRNLTSNTAINGILFNTRDITVRKIAEKAQRLSGEMQALSENSPDMIVRIGAEGKVYYANPMVERFLGIRSKQIIENNIVEISINKEVSDFFVDTLNAVLDSGKKIETETIFPLMEDKKIVQFNAIPEYNSDNELETILFVAHDITERKRIELEIEKKNKSITESINYAKRIQTAIIPDNDLIKRYLPLSFIFYKPRDVVSGDFPWFFSKGENVYIAAVDCTGHGVPGALLSFIGYFILNNIVDRDKDLSSGKILDMFHSQVRKTLKQDSPDATARDGMDVALCKINPKKRELEFSGAHRPLYHLREGNLEIHKGNLKAVGGIPVKKRKEEDFRTHKIDIKSKDKIFIFSDGLPDQIGGEAGRKYQAKRIRKQIIDNERYSMDKFNTFFNTEFKNWIGNYKQIDDILLIGIEF